ncbi:hypothetical protein Tco_0925743 [Tanacetum coccineum]|uniref:NAC domain-containing protein n=1 Tax=Tanacetum coccineum TaxID=301880 RepID=A0ABQ5DE05_9ASTR
MDQSPPQDLDFKSDFMRSHRDTKRFLEELLRTLKTNSPVGEPKGSNDFTEVPFDDEQILRQHNTAHVTPPPFAYALTPPVLATMEPLDTILIGDEVISTIPEKENDEFIKSSVDDFVPIPRKSELTLDSTDLECSMPIDPPLPCPDILGDTIGETNDLIPILRVFDEPLGNSDLVPRSYDVTFSNPLFDFNDDYTLCYDNLLFDEEFEDISSLDPPESTLVIDESSLLVTPPPASKQLSLREVERFICFILPDTVGWKDEGDGDPFFGFSSYAITPSCCILTYRGDVLLFPSPPHIG